MPHCIVEHSQELEPFALLNAVFQGAVKSALFEDDDIKTRAIAFENYRIESTSKNFVHVTLKILSGRTKEQKYQLAHVVLSELETLHYASISITIEVVDIARESYAKKIIGQ